jgi:hypothetical protein
MNEADLKMRFMPVTGSRPRYHLGTSPSGNKRVGRSYVDYVTRRFQVELMDEDETFSGLPHELWPPQTDSS